MTKDYTNTIERVYQLFSICPDPNKAETSDGWSVKEVLGHLLDSLSNNHQRLSRCVPRGHLAFPAYDQETFVERGQYQTFPFRDLLSLWYLYNQLFLHMIVHLSPEALNATIAVGERPTMSIAELIEGYFAHIEVHERQVERIIRA